MLKKDQPANIFDSLSRTRVEKTPAPKQPMREQILKEETPKQQTSNQEQTTKIGILHPAAYNDKSRAESGKMIEEINKMREKLDDTVQEIYEQTGLSPSMVEKLVESSISPKLLEDVKKLEKDIQKAFGSTIRVISKGEKTKIALNKKRKGKTLGARKKWIPMH